MGSSGLPARRTAKSWVVGYSSPIRSVRICRLLFPNPVVSEYTVVIREQSPRCPRNGHIRFFLNHGAVRLFEKNFLLQILSGLHHVVRPAEITPIIFVGAKGEDFFSVSGETQIGGDDGENAFFNHYGKKTRRNNVDAGKSQRLHLL